MIGNRRPGKLVQSPIDDNRRKKGEEMFWIGLVVALWLRIVVGAEQPNVQNLHGRYDAQSDGVFVSWSSPQTGDAAAADIQYQIKYRIANREPPENEWHYKRLQVTESRLELPPLRDGDDIEIEVKSELDGGRPGQSLIINVIKKGADWIGDESDDVDESANLFPPLNFRAQVLDPNTVKLEWEPYGVFRSNEMYFIINVKQLTNNGGAETPLRQQIKVEANEFVMGNLKPAERYEMTIRTATSPDRASTTAAIVDVVMPNAEEYFEVGNLLVSSKFHADGSGMVNLTWDVPEEVREKINGFTLEYAVSGDPNRQSLRFGGEQLSTILSNLKSDTEYVVRVKTELKNGVETESGEFRFKTPKVNPNPITRVDVIYSSDNSDIRLEWTLQPSVDKAAITGYDVYVSENKETPESQWRHVPVESTEQSVSIDQLRKSTVYFARIHARMNDGTTLKSSVIYRFTTLDDTPRSAQDLYPRSVEIRGPQRFSYRNLRPGQTEITWTFSPAVSTAATEARIFYTTDLEEEDVNSDVWSHIDVALSSETKQNAILENLQEDSVYFIRVVPLVNGQPNMDHSESFSVKTSKHSLKRSHGHRHRRHRPHVQYNEAKAFQKIQLCDPSRNQTCAHGSICIPVASSYGWCLQNAEAKRLFEFASAFPNAML